MTSKSVEIPAPSKYGAIEIKKYINKATIKGFGITMIVFFILIFGYIGAVAFKENQAKVKGPIGPIVKTNLENLELETATEEIVAPPPDQTTIINQGPAARAGVPVPVPETELTEDLQEFANIDELARASSEGNEGGLDLGGMASNIDVNREQEIEVKVVEEEPGIDDFIPVEQNPSTDQAELARMIKYPEIAKRQNIEGIVYVRVLVGKDGTVKKTVVQSSDNKLLDNAAVTALKKCTWTPAIQNNRPITCWVTIPVEFTLR